MGALLALAAIFLLGTAPVSAQLQFTDVTPTRMPVDNDNAYAVSPGDVDGDGDLDMVVGNYGQQDRLYLNDGYGTFSDATATRMPVDNKPTYDAALGDVDGDGDLDIVFGSWQQQNRLYLNDGYGTFSDATATRMPRDIDRTTVVEMGDVDGDGDLDLVFGNGWPGQQDQLYLNDGTGTYANATAARMPVDSDATEAVALGDVDGDGHLDIVFASVSPLGYYSWFDHNRVYLNDGTGTFTRARPIPSSDIDRERPSTVTLGDVDGDRDLDLVLGNKNSQNRLYLNDGTGTFTEVTAARMPVDNDYTRAVTLGDIDGDGDVDVVFGNWGQNRLYLNDGNGTFSDATGIRMPVDNETALDAVLGDVDGDGDLDIVFGNSSQQNRLYVNLVYQLDAPSPARVGFNYQLDVYARYGTAGNGDTAHVLLASAAANLPLSPFGTLFLDPSTLVALPPIAIPQPSGVTAVGLNIPNVPSLAGKTLYAQALIVQQQQTIALLTNATRDQILR